MNEKEVAALLGVSVGTMRRRRLLNQQPAAIKIGAAVRYSRTAVETFLRSCRTIGEAHGSADSRLMDGGR
jgi:predicted DNA-binding transcriptional regulator AlpA